MKISIETGLEASVKKCENLIRCLQEMELSERLK